ncbi:MAG: hypothetical protein EOO13_16135 [Chitinophagaceae bacterium]|nr:MAG: hypothetical protein EOO13_16135 [Chitinophagaceae bacterium]
MRKTTMSILLVMLRLVIFGQEVTKTENTVVEETQWYMQPWAWIAGGVILIMALIGLFRRRK